MGDRWARSDRDLDRSLGVCGANPHPLLPPSPESFNFGAGVSFLPFFSPPVAACKTDHTAAPPSKVRLLVVPLSCAAGLTPCRRSPRPLRLMLEPLRPCGGAVGTPARSSNQSPPSWQQTVVSTERTHQLCEEDTPPPSPKAKPPPPKGSCCCWYLCSVCLRVPSPPLSICKGAPWHHALAQ